MNKQIKSSDWLTRRYSEEELANIKEQAIKEAEAELRNKQIEEMARDLSELSCTNKCKNCTHFYNEYEVSCVDMNFAEKLYAKGYRKQSEGEWILEHETYGKMRCSVCGKECPTERKPDPYEDYQMTDFYITSPFCPNCGAKMKGGE